MWRNIILSSCSMNTCKTHYLISTKHIPQSMRLEDRGSSCRRRLSSCLYMTGTFLILVISALGSLALVVLLRWNSCSNCCCCWSQQWTLHCLVSRVFFPTRRTHRFLEPRNTHLRRTMNTRNRQSSSLHTRCRWSDHTPDMSQVSNRTELKWWIYQTDIVRWSLISSSTWSSPDPRPRWAAMTSLWMSRVQRMLWDPLLVEFQSVFFTFFFFFLFLDKILLLLFRKTLCQLTILTFALINLSLFLLHFIG